MSAPDVLWTRAVDEWEQWYGSPRWAVWPAELVDWLTEHGINPRDTLRVEVVVADGHAVRAHLIRRTPSLGWYEDIDGQVITDPCMLRLRSYPPGYDGPRA